MKTTAPPPPPDPLVRDAPAFDFYPERWLVGVAGMSDAEQLSYLRLLCHQWLLQGLPAEEAALRRLCGGRGVTPALLAKLPLCPDGRRRNTRLEIVRQEQRERIAKSRDKIARMNTARAALRAAREAPPTQAAPEATPRQHAPAPCPHGHAPADDFEEILLQQHHQHSGQIPHDVLEALREEGCRAAPVEGPACALVEGPGERLAEPRGVALREPREGTRGDGLAGARGEARGGPPAERLEDALAEPPGGFLTAHRPPPTTEVPEDANNARARERVAETASREEAAPPPHAPPGSASTGHRPEPAPLPHTVPAQKPPPLAATPGLATVQAWAATIGCPPDKAEIWWHEHEARPLSLHGLWTDRDGHAVRSPQNALAAWWQKWQANDLQRSTRLHPPATTSRHGTASPAIPRTDTANRPGRYA